MNNNKKTPNPVDILVGSRVRLFRTQAGMSQDKLGEKLGVTFQQIQKYEKGSNRVSASMLQKISDALLVPIAQFFEDPDAQGLAEDGDAYAADFLSTPEGKKLRQAFNKVKDPKVRKRIVDLVVSLAEES